MLGKTDASGGLAALRADLQRLVKKFDAKPLAKSCAHCHKPATLVSAYWGNDEALYPWCDTCDPYTLGALDGKLARLRTFKDAIDHVEFRCGAKKASYDRIVRAFAEAKGLPGRVGEAAAKKFFA
ncbi:MAG: hypothetical protein EPN57_18340 [Paraburkholderia sp.]|nr:MAG: hypothetical protein EPN57_18340 [Paraburkholderia sp.]